MRDLTNPPLHTSRLILRPMRAIDFDDVLLIFTDPKVMASFDGILFDHSQMTRWLQRNLEHQLKYGYGLFSVIHQASGLLIGDCGLEIMDVDGTSVAELGYDFRSTHWQQGFATEAALAVRDYAFQALNLPQLVSIIRVGNRASERVAEKVGMARLGMFERYGHPYWKYGMSRGFPLVHKREQP